jgi:hypothetical protein
MFVDWKHVPPPPPWEPEPRRRAGRNEAALMWIVGANLLALLFAPIANATVFQGIARALGF